MPKTVSQPLHSFIDDFLRDFFAAHPESATASGVHTYDHMLPGLSARGIARDVTRLKRALTRLKSLEPRQGTDSGRKLSPQTRLDFQLMKNSVESALFDLEELRSWERDPNYYNDRLHLSLFLLMRRKFAPLPERVESIIARERGLPTALEAAQKNLRRVPRLVAQLAISQCQGTVHFLKTSLPEAVRPVRDPKLLARFEQSNAEAIKAYGRFVEFLKHRLLPRTVPHFGIGEQQYRRKLWCDEMVELPLNTVLQKGYESLAEHEALFRETASKIDSRKSAESILEAMTRDHPPGDQIVRSTAAVLNRLQQFLLAQDLISLPAGSGSPGTDPCTVEESPEFLRALTFASLEVPGPLEKKAREYFYYVTLPDPHWDAQKQEQHLRFFSRHLILTTSIHEAYPGHLLHFLWVNRHPSKLRRLFGAASHVEGWAHYCEQMMIEEGFGGGDPRLQLAQLHEAQLRLCRLIVGIEMHVNDMTFRQARNFFIRHAHMQPLNADREAKRGIVDPTYLVYTLGKMQFLRLREDLKKKLGAPFSLKQFHNACVQNGFPPIPLLRELLLGERRTVI